MAASRVLPRGRGGAGEASGTAHALHGSTKATQAADALCCSPSRCTARGVAWCMPGTAGPARQRARLRRAVAVAGRRRGAPREDYQRSLPRRDALVRAHLRRELAVVAGGARGDLGVEDRAHGGALCPGRKPPRWAVKRPARPYNRAMQNRFTMENARALHCLGRARTIVRVAGELVARVAEQVAARAEGQGAVRAARAEVAARRHLDAVAAAAAPARA